MDSLPGLAGLLEGEDWDDGWGSCDDDGFAASDPAKGVTGGEAEFGAVPLLEGFEASAGLAAVLTVWLAMADVSGSVSVTVLRESSPATSQTLQIFSTVVIGMLGVWMPEAPGNVQPQCVVVRVVVFVVYPVEQMST